MEWGSSSEIEYAFNGKEKMEAHGFNMYDYGARFYDQTLARWHSMDPLAEKYYSISPYAYCAGNPVMFVDPDGKQPRIFIETKGFGHAFASVGTGENTVVYTYGRYGDLKKDKSIARNTNPIGEGVLIKLTGNDAKNS
ncbi:MAG: RHS repeat-associated core domain-containing protein [Bacteroidales bacterium]